MLMPYALLASASNSAQRISEAGNMLISILNTFVYGFYIFSGCALLYCVLQFKQGNMKALVHGFLGAALFALAPTIISAILNQI